VSPSSRHRRLAEFFSIPTQDVNPRQSLPFSLFLYLQQNEHLLLWRASGDPIEKSELDRIQNSGFSKLWIPNPERHLYEHWKEAHRERSRAITPEGALIRAVLGSSSEGDSRLTRARFCEEAGRTLLSRCCRSKTLEEEQERDARMHFALLDALSATGALSSSLKSLWSLSLSFSKPIHSLGVSMMAVILGMGFKKSDPQWLATLALAALFKNSPHPKEALSHALDPSHLEPVLQWVQGSGDQNSSFETDDAISILRLASAVEAVRSGSYDQKPKLRSEAFKILAEPQSHSTTALVLNLPNPEFLSPALRWISEYSKFQLKVG